MKICLVNTLYAPHGDGGAERSVRSLAEALQRMGIEAVVVRCGTERGEYEVSGVRVVCVPIANLYWPFSGPHRSSVARLAWHAIDSYNMEIGRRVRKVLEREKPDVVHTNVLAALSVSVWGAARRVEAPVVHTLRDYYLLCPRSTMYRAGRNCRRPCLGCRVYGMPRKLASSGIDHVVGISDFVLRRHLDNGYFRGVHSSVIPNGYAVPETLPPRPRARTSYRIGYLGRIAPAKGIERLIEAVRASRYAGRVVLRIAGAGDERYADQLRKACAGIDTQFLGVVAPEAFFQDVDVLVVPSSYHEPLGRVVIEAYANGAPVLAARRGGLPELVDHGVTGHLFDPDEPGSLQRELDLMLARMEAEPQRLELVRRRAFERARAFKPERITREYAAVYQAAVTTHAGKGL
jgi:glycosyltransferase involved in cell wall biosynthesis